MYANVDRYMEQNGAKMYGHIVEEPVLIRKEDIRYTVYLLILANFFHLSSQAHALT